MITQATEDFRDTASSPVAPVPLPRLVYLSDVPVESGCHGSALVYRLLSQYPASRLLIVEPADHPSDPVRRVKGVRYEVLETPSSALSKRLGRTRFSGWVSAWRMLHASNRASEVEQLIGEFHPTAVLTVSHNVSWLAAAEFAGRQKIPLHLIVHDDWPRLVPVAGSFRAHAEKVFGEIYRAAESRLCVSPHMESTYRQRYGAEGTVLYPARSSELPEFTTPAERTRIPANPFTIGFAGSLFTRDYVRQLKCLAGSVAEIGGRLVIYGPYNAESLERMGLNLPAVQLGGMHSSTDLVREFRTQIDALFLPMSFAPEDALAMSLNFPSKLTDYSAAGLPILIWGPKESSAVRWAEAEPGVAIVLMDASVDALRACVEKLRTDSELRWRLGRAVLEVGRKYFSAERAQEIFEGCLRGNRKAN
jgi:glycosyltransferase involved in cell wall biosynthesis